MKTAESDGSRGYKYYPIAYSNGVLTTMISLNNLRYVGYTPWATPVDKTKFLDGLNSDYSTGYPDLKIFNILSVGF